jgi:glycine cleavage system protein P-like pyridoxal-binding family
VGQFPNGQTGQFPSGGSNFFGAIEHLAFEAVMLPDRSWWSPKIPAKKRRYVLQHEQIHFALAELTARRLTIDAPKWVSDVLVIEPTAQKVRAELDRQIKDRVDAAMEASLKRQGEFDEDTSLFFSPKRQQWWSRRVEEELKQTRREPKARKRAP